MRAERLRGREAANATPLQNLEEDLQRPTVFSPVERTGAPLFVPHQPPRHRDGVGTPAAGGGWLIRHCFDAPPAEAPGRARGAAELIGWATAAEYGRPRRARPTARRTALGTGCTPVRRATCQRIGGNAVLVRRRRHAGGSGNSGTGVPRPGRAGQPAVARRPNRRGSGWFRGPGGKAGLMGLRHRRRRWYATATLTMSDTRPELEMPGERGTASLKRS